MSAETTPTTLTPDQVGAETPETATNPESGFSRSMLISATRCLLTYVFFPFVAPLFGLASDIGPTLGLIIGVVAIYFNVASLRRFWVARHRLRIPMTFIHVGVIALLTILVVEDISDLLG